MSTKTRILSHEEIQHKVRRIAYQIYESNMNENQLILAGISKSGYIFAEKLKETLNQICNLEIQLCEVHINKRNPLDTITTSLPEEIYTNQAVILVDDVLNSGAPSLMQLSISLTYH